MVNQKKIERIYNSRISDYAICKTPVSLFQQKAPEGKNGKNLGSNYGKFIKF